MKDLLGIGVVETQNLASLHARDKKLSKGQMDAALEEKGMDHG